MPLPVLHMHPCNRLSGANPWQQSLQMHHQQQPLWQQQFDEITREALGSPKSASIAKAHSSGSAASGDDELALREARLSYYYTAERSRPEPEARASKAPAPVHAFHSKSRFRQQGITPPPHAAISKAPSSLGPAVTLAPLPTQRRTHTGRLLLSSRAVGAHKPAHVASSRLGLAWWWLRGASVRAISAGGGGWEAHCR